MVAEEANICLNSNTILSKNQPENKRRVRHDNPKGNHPVMKQPDDG